MPGTSEAIHLIDLASARLRQDIGGLSQRPQEAAEPQYGRPPEPDHLLWRARMLHAAWGPNDRPLSPDYLSRLATGLPAGVTVDPSGLDASCLFPPRIGRIVLNLLLLASESLPSGGTVMLAGTADDLFIRISGPAAAWPPGMASCLVNEADACAAMRSQNGLQMPLTALLAHATGVRLSFLLASSSRTEPPILRLGGR